MKCFLVREATTSRKESSADEGDKKEKKKPSPTKAQAEGSRSQHQRLQAIELYQVLIRVAQKDAKAKAVLSEKFALLGAVICKVIKTADSWVQKKVKKTGMCIGLFAKAAKVLLSSDVEVAGASEPKKLIAEVGVAIMKELETATE